VAGYFSYNEIKDVSVTTTTILLPQKTLCFLKTQITKSKLPILLMAFRPDNQLPLLQCRFDKTLVGYENGLIVVINEADGAMLKVVDIINKQLPANRKKVNHFMEFDGIVYVSVTLVLCNLI
jgi:hypothetical protein